RALGPRISVSGEVCERPELSSPHRIDAASRRCRRQRRDGVLLLVAAEERPGPQALADPRIAPDRDDHLDREGPSPASSTGPPGPIEPRRALGGGTGSVLKAGPAVARYPLRQRGPGDTELSSDMSDR